jgi:hypothetical protein
VGVHAAGALKIVRNYPPAARHGSSGSDPAYLASLIDAKKLQVVWTVSSRSLRLSRR